MTHEWRECECISQCARSRRLSGGCVRRAKNGELNLILSPASIIFDLYVLQP